jgi:hypothetical protein
VPLQRLGRRALAHRLRRLVFPAEDPGTAALIRALRIVRRRGEFTRAELLVMARWKSPRAEAHYRRNRAAAVRAISRGVLASRSERARMELLTRLHGVSVPVASAILTLLDPRRYGVLDIRVWQLLHATDPSLGNPRGQGFTVEQWERFLAVLRAEARRRRVTPRALEWALFHAHRTLQRGRLYDPPYRAGTAERGEAGTRQATRTPSVTPRVAAAARSVSTARRIAD